MCTRPRTGAFCVGTLTLTPIILPPTPTPIPHTATPVTTIPTTRVPRGSQSVSPHSAL